MRLHNFIKFLVFVGFGGVVLSGFAHAAPADQDNARRDFQAAQSALHVGNLTRFKKLRQGFNDYVLAGYLDYEYLKDRVEQTPAVELHAFLEAYGYVPGSDQIRKRWLRSLAARGNWEVFTREYKDVDDDVELQCIRLNHLLRSSEHQASLMQEAETLWQTGRRLPPVCDNVFTAWKKAGHMTADHVWDRIRRAFEARQVTLASDLGRYLELHDRVWLNRWIAMHRDPANELDRIHYPVETPVARMIVRHGIVRLGLRDVEAALSRWETLEAQHKFFGEDDNYVFRHLGILALQERSPVAVTLLSRVSAQGDDEMLFLARVRAAILAGDWEAARRSIVGLPEDRQQKQEWRYWLARSLDATGQKDKARELFQALALERGYYGFLSADRIGGGYAMQHQPIVASPEEVSAMLARPGIQAAQEFYAMGSTLEARRQWHWNMRQMNNRELAVAAVIAREWGWYDRAILTVSKSDHLDDLEIRFPLLFREPIEANATRFGIDPGWVYGVVRQESAFMVDARSPVGALGLMQLMPATGRLTSRQLNVPIRGMQGFLDAENNIKLGVGYLKEVLGRNQNHQALATASYNAGPNRVASWLPAKPMEADVWVEGIPFNETRDYVKNVMAFTAVYDHRLGVKPILLKDRMPEVKKP